MYAAFQQIVNDTPDSEIERSNITHKHFIEALTESFEVLGGEVWADDAGSSSGRDEDDDQYFHNAFSALSVSAIEDDTASSADETQVTSRRIQKKKAGKGKKERRARNPNKRPCRRQLQNLLRQTSLWKAIVSSMTRMASCQSISGPYMLRFGNGLNFDPTHRISGGKLPTRASTLP